MPLRPVPGQSMSSPQMTRMFGFFGISWTFCVFCWAFCGTDPKLLSLPSQASEQRHGGELSKVTEVARGLCDFFDIGQLPCFVEERLLRAVETEEHFELSGAIGRNAGGFFACRRFGCEVDVD